MHKKQTGSSSAPVLASLCQLDLDSELAMFNNSLTSVHNFTLVSTTKAASRRRQANNTSQQPQAETQRHNATNSNNNNQTNGYMFDEFNEFRLSEDVCGDVDVDAFIAELDASDSPIFDLDATECNESRSIFKSNVPIFSMYVTQQQQQQLPSFSDNDDDADAEVSRAVNSMRVRYTMHSQSNNVSPLSIANDDVSLSASPIQQLAVVDASAPAFEFDDVDVTIENVPCWIESSEGLETARKRRVDETFVVQARPCDKKQRRSIDNELEFNADHAQQQQQHQQQQQQSTPFADTTGKSKKFRTRLERVKYESKFYNRQRTSSHLAAAVAAAAAATAEPLSSNAAEEQQHEFAEQQQYEHFSNEETCLTMHNDNESRNYKPSYKVEELLNDTRGMKKYLVDYDDILMMSALLPANATANPAMIDDNDDDDNKATSGRSSSGYLSEN